MPAFFLTFLACLVVTIAGREQLRVARLSAALGPGPGLWLVVVASSLLTTLFAAWLGHALAPAMAGAGKQMFVALALLLAGLEVAILRAPARPQEPTRSTGAIFIVLAAAQFTDAARFIVLAMVVATDRLELTFAGGAAGALAALSIAMVAGQRWEQNLPVRRLAQVVGALLVLAALVLGMSARGISL